MGSKVSKPLGLPETFCWELSKQKLWRASQNKSKRSSTLFKMVCGVDPAFVTAVAATEDGEYDILLEGS